MAGTFLEEKLGAAGTGEVWDLPCGPGICCLAQSPLDGPCHPPLRLSLGFWDKGGVSCQTSLPMGDCPSPVRLNLSLLEPKVRFLRSWSWVHVLSTPPPPGSLLGQLANSIGHPQLLLPAANPFRQPCVKRGRVRGWRGTGFRRADVSFLMDPGEDAAPGEDVDPGKDTDPGEEVG